jgi:hypothetical protein
LSSAAKKPPDLKVTHSSWLKDPMAVYYMYAGAQAVSFMLGKICDQTLAFVGEEEMTTPAGRFTTDHFRVHDTVKLHITGPDTIMVRFQWIPAGRDYVLNCLEVGQ